MPRHQYAYDKYMTQTDEGKALYSIWKRIRKSLDENGLFYRYPNFFNWAMENGYAIGRRLRRIDDSLPYAPENCTFNPDSDTDKHFTVNERIAINNWNKTVNLFRKKLGMKLFEVVTEEEIYARL